MARLTQLPRGRGAASFDLVFSAAAWQGRVHSRPPVPAAEPGLLWDLPAGLTRCWQWVLPVLPFHREGD